MERRGNAGGEYGKEKCWMLRGRREGDHIGEEEEEGRDIPRRKEGNNS